MTYAVIAMERAMKIQEVILRAMSGALTWPQAADILGMHPRILRRARGRHRRRREPRPCFGELLHLDGSPHAWLARCPDQRQTLIAVLDDATQRLLYAQLWSAETTTTVMSALGDVFRTCGLPGAL